MKLRLGSMLVLPAVVACISGTNAPLIVNGSGQAAESGAAGRTGAAGTTAAGGTTAAAGVTGAAGTIGIAGAAGAAGAFMGTAGSMAVTGAAGSMTSACSDGATAAATPGETGWINRTPAALPASWPKARRNPAMAFDVAANRTVMFGGYANAFPATDTWLWDGNTGQWSQPKVDPAGVFDMFAVVYDSARARTLLFGGETYPDAGPSSNVWEWNGLAPKWSLIQTAGGSAPPADLKTPVAAYDPLRRRVLVHGGWPNDETHEWDPATRVWTDRTQKLQPQRASGSAMVWDPCRDRAVFFGGTTSAEVWEWNPTTGAWTQRVRTGAWPPARSAASLVFDTSVGHPLLFGGVSYPNSGPLDPTMPADNTPTHFNDLWEWVGDAGAWAQFYLPADAPRPDGREWSGVAYDSVRHRLVVFAGGTDRFDDATLWEWARP